MNIWSKSPEWNSPSSKDASSLVPGGRGLMELGSLRKILSQDRNPPIDAIIR